MTHVAAFLAGAFLTILIASVLYAGRRSDDALRIMALQEEIAQLCRARTIQAARQPARMAEDYWG